MSSGVWMSSVLSASGLGNKQGSRTKFFGHAWNPAEFELPVPPDAAMTALRRYKQGQSLAREDFPEAEAVWDERRFSKRRELFFVGPFFAVQGRLAEVLSKFDLGTGGLIPFTIFESDLETPYSGEFNLLNFGSIKNSILPERCEGIQKFAVRKEDGKQIWQINELKDGVDVVFSERALQGSDLWFEDAVYNKIFMSENLAQSILEIGLGDVFKLTKCRIAGDVA